MKTSNDPATVHYVRIPLEDHTVLHKVQIRDQSPTVTHEVELKPAKNTIVHDVTMLLSNTPKPTFLHDVELQFISDSSDNENDYQIIAQGEVIEPEMLIRANGEDILIERIHPAYVIADNTPKENPKLTGKSHM